MKTMLKSMRWLLLISGILIVILGITMLFTPLENLATLAIFIGISILISGISEIVSFCGEEKGRRDRWMLASGILSTIFGIWTIFGSGAQALISFISFILAVWILISSIMRIIDSISLKSKNSSIWGWVPTFAFGIIGAVFGIVLLFSPLLSRIIISVSIALILISHGVDNILIFFRIKKIGNYIRERLGE